MKQKRVEPRTSMPDLSVGTLGGGENEVLEHLDNDRFLRELRDGLPPMSDDEFQTFVKRVKANLTPEEDE